MATACDHGHILHAFRAGETPAVRNAGILPAPLWKKTSNSDKNGHTSVATIAEQEYIEKRLPAMLKGSAMRNITENNMPPVNPR